MMRSTKEAVEYYMELLDKPLPLNGGGIIPGATLARGGNTSREVHRGLDAFYVPEINRSCAQAIVNIVLINGMSICICWSATRSVQHEGRYLYSPPPNRFRSWEHFIFHLFCEVVKSYIQNGCPSQPLNTPLIRYCEQIGMSLIATIGSFLICYKLGRHRKQLDRNIIYHTVNGTNMYNSACSDKVREAVMVTSSIVDRMLGLTTQSNIYEFDYSENCIDDNFIIDWNDVRRGDAIYQRRGGRA